MFSDTDEYTPWYQNRRITIPAILILLVIAAVLLYVFVLGRGLAFSVDFKDIKGLTQGSPLYWNGLEIGRVTGIGPSSQPSLVRVDLVADRKYQDDLHVDSVFQVIAAPVAGGKYPLAIQVEVVNPASTAIPRGTVFTGANNPTEAYLQAAKYAGTDAADKFLRLGDLRVESTFQPGAIERTFVLETGLLIPAGTLYAGILPDGEGWQREESNTERSNIIRVEGTSPTVAGAQWSLTETRFIEEKHFLWIDYYYEEEVIAAEAFPLDAVDMASLTECLSDPIGCLGEIVQLITQKGEDILKWLEGAGRLPAQALQVQMSVKMPGTIVETTAPEHRGATATWTLAGNELTRGFTMSAHSRMPNWLTVGILGGVILVGLILLLVISAQRRAALMD
ncbi:MAG TPA: MCE family protein [Anaerolineaceae bacterium]|nr:MCE family protein [Anaerolineaceae bacterium]HOD43599.1 MCE family protein [Anaerolineaceae bacterium]HPA32170.1 MCE family protein [Anaerolineaceae bacterium]HQF45123.1 MCE family protein [Anaerolineaceae bacterium]HQH34978.1 MCE family protein [Anaerolineaceae bacterium]